MLANVSVFGMIRLSRRMVTDRGSFPEDYMLTRWTIACFLILVCGPIALADDRVEVKEAVKRVLRACAEGDEKALLAAALPIDEKKLDDLRILLRESKASLTMVRLLFKRFEDAKDVWPEDTDEEIKAALKEVDGGEVKLDGDAATVSFGPEGKERQTVACRRVNGTWKAEVPARLMPPEGRPPIGSRLPDWKELATSWTRRCEAMTARLERGEFKSASEARDAFEARTKKP
jgi:hypothetical protein